MVQALELPYFLRDYSNLLNHFTEQFDELNSKQIGDKFADLVELLINRTDIGKQYNSPQRQQDSYDKGADFIAKDAKGSMLVTQSKYRIRGKDDFSLIISKFENFQKDYLNEELPLFANAGVSTESIDIVFQIVTMHSLENIIKKFENSSLSSRKFYKELVDTNRLHIFDGKDILHYLQDAYTKSFVIPTEITLNLAHNPIEWQDVFVGIIAGVELTDIYSKYGDSIFFENIRDYLYMEDGSATTDVNQEIISTIQEDAEKMLARNNGIVIKADDVQFGDYSKSLILKNASIVNGCQTTISLINAEITNPEDLYILVKVVKTEKGWDVARTANRQNEVGKLELQIAEFLRPQRLKKSAAKRGISLNNSDSAIGLMNTVYKKSVVYDDMRALFIGIFSRSPQNLFSSSRSAILANIMADFYENDPEGEKLFDDLFTIQYSAEKCIELLRKISNQSETGSTFQRFLKDSTYSYRAYLTILAICVTAKTDISSATTDEERYNSRRNMIKKAVSIIENDFDKFEKLYREAFRTIIMSAPKDIAEDAVKQRLWDHMKRLNFSRVYNDTLMSSDLSQL